MLTGISSDAELQSLEKLFSAGELLRITDLLQKTMAGLSKSLNLRTDAELCLLQLCNPALQLDAAALGARLSRLEEAVGKRQGGHFHSLSRPSYSGHSPSAERRGYAALGRCAAASHSRRRAPWAR